MQRLEVFAAVRARVSPASFADVREFSRGSLRVRSSDRSIEPSPCDRGRALRDLESKAGS